MFSVVETGGLEEKIRVFLIGVEPATFWPQLFKSWIALSPGEITIQRKSVRETNYAIRWIEICPGDSAIHLLNNWDLVTSQTRCFTRLPMN